MVKSPANEHIAFISTMMAVSWAGSEELWSRTAALLREDGFIVSASVVGWSPPAEQVLGLVREGVAVWPRRIDVPLWLKAWRRLAIPEKSNLLIESEKFLAETRPSLVVISDSGFPPIELLELCGTKKIQFVTIGHMDTRGHWLRDEQAERYGRILPSARRCYFVSNASLETAERQLGLELTNGEVIRNPFNVDFSVSLPWPPLTDADELRLACVGRLQPSHKGQDILIEALAGSQWMNRNWRLTLYGEGPTRRVLERLVQRFGMSGRVSFGGHIPPKQIWTDNHALIMPSRYESLPLAMVEAMLCGRPVLATDVGGHAEIIEDGVTGFLAESATINAVQRSLERLWGCRKQLREMGTAGAKRIRELVPPDPIRAFADKLTAFL
jgi:glycosyltransferase involved in cell wall biosynthesis